MRFYPLSRDHRKKPFPLPATATQWRVWRHTGGRPLPQTDSDEQPLYLALDGTVEDLEAAGCAPGRILLDAVDAKRKSLGLTRAVVDLRGVEAEIEPPPAEADKAEAEPEPIRAVNPEPVHEGYTRIIEAIHKAGVARDQALLQYYAERDKALFSTISAMANRITAPTPNVRDHVQTLQSLQTLQQRNAGPSHVLSAPESATAQWAAAAAQQQAEGQSPEQGAIQAVQSLLGPLMPFLTLWAAKKSDFSRDEMGILKDFWLEKNKQAQAQPVTLEARAPSVPSYPPELEPVLAELSPAERSDAEAFLSSAEATPDAIAGICADIRKQPTLAAQVALAKEFVAFIKTYRR